MKHKYSEMIKAKAENMELVVFCKDSYDSEARWEETNQLPVQEEFEYFLCHPKHKVPVLHWLNGWNVVYSHTIGGEISIIPEEGDRISWILRDWYMDEMFESIIVPNKEKRWIVVETTRGSNDNWCSRAYLSKEEAMGLCNKITSPPNNKLQLIEIEVESEV